LFILDSHNAFKFFFVQKKWEETFVVSKFSIYANQQFSNTSINLEEIDLLHNFTSLQTQLMIGVLPWRGVREKDQLFVQLLIEAFSKHGDVVLDCFASTNNFH
jgi:hypothetical protein